MDRNAFKNIFPVKPFVCRLFVSFVRQLVPTWTPSYRCCVKLILRYDRKRSKMSAKRKKTPVIYSSSSEDERVNNENIAVRFILRPLDIGYANMR